MLYTSCMNLLNRYCNNLFQWKCNRLDHTLSFNVTMWKRQYFSVIFLFTVKTVGQYEVVIMVLKQEF